MAKKGRIYYLEDKQQINFDYLLIIYFINIQKLFLLLHCGPSTFVGLPIGRIRIQEQNFQIRIMSGYGCMEFR